GMAMLCPELDRLLRTPWWRGLMVYVASACTAPLYYIQTIAGGVAEGPPDPQLQLHSDTFHPSLKAWLFLTDVEEDGRPLTYVAGSHRLSPERIAWEQRTSIEVVESGDRLSQRGSLRIRPDELGALGLPEPTRFCVPANTLVIADTSGFHARAGSHRQTIRVELWAYCRQPLPTLDLGRHLLAPAVRGTPRGTSPHAARLARPIRPPEAALDPRGPAAPHRPLRIRRVGVSKLAGAAGFEPANAGTKNRCLTTWLRPSRRLPHRREKRRLYRPRPALEGRMGSRLGTG